MKLGNYTPSRHNASSVVDTNGVSPTVMENHGTITAIPVKPIRKYGLFDKDDQAHQAGSVYDAEGLSPTIDTSGGGTECR